MKPISVAYAKQLIDFAGSAGNRSPSLAEAQLQGAVAAYNMLARNGCAYLADEVGMGKTYIALGVMGLLRHAQPNARILVIAPRENIQRKWIKELHNFVRFNWRAEDNRVKSIQRAPARVVVPIGSLAELAGAAALCSSHDLYLRMTSFSLALKQAEDRRRHRDRLLRELRPINPEFLSTRDPEEFRDHYGIALNFALPKLDLLVIDEAHNLKHGFGKHVSTRNHLLAYTFGGVPASRSDCNWYERKAEHVLLLSATPFEYDYGDIARQLELFGFREHRINDADGKDPRPLSELFDPEVEEARKRELVGRLLIRRVFHLNIANRPYTKNMYRREWRNGGYARHDEPLPLSDTEQRLVVALMQKKVTEILGDRRFNNHFQIGMLSSFESFLETVAHRHPSGPVVSPGNGDGAAEGNEDVERVFDGDQDATADERLGIDSHTLAGIVKSYRRRFGRSLPHPKLDATAGALASAFETGEKALVFVRRVATVAELKDKLDVIFNDWLQRKMRVALPELRDEVDRQFAQYSEERAAARPARTESPGAAGTEPGTLRGLFEEDVGGTDTFFAWFFRGEGPPDILSGAAFQKNRLASDSSAYATFFEDDHVSWLLGRPREPIAVIAQALGRSLADTTGELRERAYARFRTRTQRRKGYPRFYVFEAYQTAALELLGRLTTPLGEQARIVLSERYEVAGVERIAPPEQFPGPEAGLGVVTFITELVKRPSLRATIWPDEPGSEFRARFRRREQRRELLSAMCRLGASYIDLYLLAIQQLGSFELSERGGRRADERPEEDLARGFGDLLALQEREPGFHACAELSQAAKTFDPIVAVNFHEIQAEPLSRSAERFGRALQHQVPVAGMSGGVNRRLVTQFRMPGFPLVLATTDVLQEGEDLHTFCRKVIHYGISWTPSALEQRTGRVDRIGSLLQRSLEGRPLEPADEEFIQVHYPHLTETVEVLQVRRVLERLNKFLRLIHRLRPQDMRSDSRIDVASEILRPLIDVQQIKEPLESAFPIAPEWLRGNDHPNMERALRIPELEAHLGTIWKYFGTRYELRELPTNSLRARCAVLSLLDGSVVRRGSAAPADSRRTQSFRLELRSQALGDATLIRCISPVGLVDLDDDRVVDYAYELHQRLGLPKLCVRPDARRRQYHLSIEGDLLLDPQTTSPMEVEELIVETVRAADALEHQLLDRDVNVTALLAEESHDGTGTQTRS